MSDARKQTNYLWGVELVWTRSPVEYRQRELSGGVAEDHIRVDVSPNEEGGQKGGVLEAVPFLPLQDGERG